METDESKSGRCEWLSSALEVRYLLTIVSLGECGCSKNAESPRKGCKISKEQEKIETKLTIKTRFQPGILHGPRHYSRA